MTQARVETRKPPNALSDAARAERGYGFMMGFVADRANEASRQHAADGGRAKLKLVIWKTGIDVNRDLPLHGLPIIAILAKKGQPS
jgi:hypothetical protein